MNSAIPTIPKAFDSLIKESNSLVKWAKDKVQSNFNESTIEFEGKTYRANRWYFNGNFARKPKEFFKYADDGKMEVCVTVRGGEYRGQKYKVQVSFTQWILEN